MTPLLPILLMALHVESKNLEHFADTIGGWRHLPVEPSVDFTAVAGVSSAIHGSHKPRPSPFAALDFGVDSLDGVCDVRGGGHPCAPVVSENTDPYWVVDCFTIDDGVVEAGGTAAGPNSAAQLPHVGGLAVVLAGESLGGSTLKDVANPLVSACLVPYIPEHVSLQKSAARHPQQRPGGGNRAGSGGVEVAHCDYIVAIVFSPLTGGSTRRSVAVWRLSGVEVGSAIVGQHHPRRVASGRHAHLYHDRASFGGSLHSESIQHSHAIVARADIAVIAVVSPTCGAGRPLDSGVIFDVIHQSLQQELSNRSAGHDMLPIACRSGFLPDGRGYVPLKSIAPQPAKAGEAGSSQTVIASQLADDVGVCIDLSTGRGDAQNNRSLAIHRPPARQRTVILKHYLLIVGRCMQRTAADAHIEPLSGPVDALAAEDGDANDIFDDVELEPIYPRHLIYSDVCVFAYCHFHAPYLGWGHVPRDSTHSSRYVLSVKRGVAYLSYIYPLTISTPCCDAQRALVHKMSVRNPRCQPDNGHNHTRPTYHVVGHTNYAGMEAA